MVYSDSRKITGKNYKCVKTTINCIKKLQKKANIDKHKASINDQTKIKNEISVFSNIKDAKCIYPSLIDKVINLVGNRIIDLILHIPVNYELWTKVQNFSQIKDGELCCIEVEITNVKLPKMPFYLSQKRKIPTIISATTFDGYKLEMVFFNLYQGLLNELKIGNKIVCKGKLTLDKRNKYIMTHPIFSKKIQEEKGCYAIFKLNQLEENEINLSNINIDKIIPIYPLCEGVKQSSIINGIKKILDNDTINFNCFDNCDFLLEQIYDFNHSLLNEKITIPTTKQCFQALHFPKSINDIKENSKYIQKLAFLELLSFQYALFKARKSRENENGFCINSNERLTEKLLKNLSFSLTEDQLSCINEIYKDQHSEKKMLRLLQGDVGSGKTIVALISALKVIESGYKVVIMAPTAILAKQHFATIQKLFFGLGVNAELLIGDTKQKARKDILTRMKLGQIHLLVGTHTLFQKKIELPNNIGLFIIDEQHNFGVEQRVSLIKKCGKADILMMSATPIPRTMVMGLYGDISISNIKHKPSNRLPIETKVLSFEDKYNKLVEAINRKVLLGEKIYWVCPLVDESEKLDYIDVNTRAKELSSVIDKNKIAILNGKMSQDNKDKTMLDFKNGKYNLLIATTVIEVGIDVPEATIIVIENAEKFGLAQLHQLRGRVGRGNKQSYCFLLYGKNISEIGMKRLNILKKCENGFEVAEFDLKLRGGGTLLNKKQSGFKNMNFVNFSRDRNILNYLNKANLDKIDYENIKPIVDLFGYSLESEGKGVFQC